jgi:lipopolysaccharide export system ATP-binding protein
VPKLTTDSLVKIYGGRKVVNHVSIELHEGEIVGLLGPNGAGKTTTFNMIIGFVRPTSGGVYFDSMDITRLPMYKRARLGIGYLTQEVSIFRKLTVEENIMAILQTLHLTRDEQKKRLEQLLDEMGIGHLAKNKAYTLSGGERRRAEIARALVTAPCFILLDEPFSGVDPKAVEELQMLIYQMRARGLGILITDHSVRETLQVTDRSYLIYEGNVELSGTAEELVTNDRARALYLGERFYMDTTPDVRKESVK